ncbi:phosphoglycerate dehydrogenase [Bacillus sp. 03113]|uniref:phosphoglycerate dehydrogenase n=1 Tax=Bacillus sp. 03113 TaxID=2578211 RepID=UPI0011427D55|nr:phosphoglycerate dehydrogenase [Bacillus sp. 03113]
MVKALLTLPTNFFNAYSELATNIEKLGVNLKCLISDQPIKKEVIIENIKDVEIYIVGLEKVDKEIIDAAANLKYIIKQGVGIDNIDVSYAAEKNIQVTNAPGQNASSVADLTLGLILSIARNIPETNQMVKTGQWDIKMGYDLLGKKLGIIGFGAIGKEIARRAGAFGMNMIAYGNFKDYEAAEKLKVEFVELNELLSTSDFIVISTSLTNKSYHLINEVSFNIMKKTAFLINISRGEVVDEDALIKALKEGQINGAALDVYKTEPPNLDLVELPNVICTPHIGGSTFECASRIGSITEENIKKYIARESLNFVTN